MEFLLFILIILIVVMLFKINSIIDNQEFILSKIAILFRKMEGLSKESIIKEIKNLLSTISSLEQKIEKPEIKKVPQPPKIEPRIIKEKVIKKAIPIKKVPQEPSFFEKIFESFNFEEWIINNLLLKIGVVIFVLGIGFFLKYSIEENLIPIWMRVAIGIAVGNALIFTGMKMLNQPKYFSASFFGAGIAVLYLSIYAGYAIDSFKILDFKVALMAMVIVTIFAGFISVRFNFLSTAIFGLIGGFLTPFLISTGSININGFLSYILLLNLGILYISIYKRWVILSWLSFVLTTFLTNSSIVKSRLLEQDSFSMLVLFISIFFILYSIIPFINDIREKREELKNSLVFLFSANFLVVVATFANLFFTYDIDKLYFSIVTIVLAMVFILFVVLMQKYSLFIKNLLTISLSQSLLLILITPFIVFDSLSLTLILALESLILMFIGYRTKQNTFIIFSYFGYLLTGLNLLMDLKNSILMHHNLMSISLSIKIWINNLVTIGSFFGGWYLLKKIREFKFFEILEVNLITQNRIKIVFFFSIFYISFVTILNIGNEFLLLIFFGYEFFISFIFITFFSFIFLIRENEYFGLTTWFLKILYFIFAFMFLFKILDSLSYAGWQSIIISFINFMIISTISFYIYKILFEKDTIMIGNFKVEFLFLSFGYISLFIFLNVEIYNIFNYFYNSNAANTSLTFLWVIYAITTMIVALKKEINIAKKVGIGLLIIAILKAFFVDLSNAEPIYKIVLFIVVGMILFISSYYYNKLYQKKRLNEK